MVGESIGAIAWVVIALAIGFVGFFLMILTFIVRAFAAVFRGVFHDRDDHTAHVALRAGPQQIVCPHARCGHRNPQNGIYCARCGRPLRRSRKLDAYG